jgi:hypothetical protein
VETSHGHKADVKEKSLRVFIPQCLATSIHTAESCMIEEELCNQSTLDRELSENIVRDQVVVRDQVGPRGTSRTQALLRGTYKLSGSVMRS